jgi:N-acetylneuraminic acid mutarotase
MIQPSYGEAAGTLSSGNIIVAGGLAWNDGSAEWLNSAEIYDPGSNTWTATTDMPSPTALAGSAVSNGLFYVFGGGAGFPGNALAIFDPSNDSWTVGPSMPLSVEYVAGATLPNGDIMAIGGLTSSGDTSSVEAYDPTTSTWSSLAPLPVACQSVGAATGPNGDVYVVGGSCTKHGDSWSKQLLLYNQRTNTWSTGVSMSKGRAWPAVAFGPKGKLYVAGGYHTKGVLSTVSIYHASTSTWSSGSSLPFAEYQQAAVAASSGIVVLGGCGGDAGTPNCPSNQAILLPLSA